MKPELIKFVAGTKAKASEVNENFEKVLDYAETAGAIVIFDIETEYKFGQWVLGQVDDKFGLYESQVEENRGHLLSDENYWKKVTDDEVVRIVGEIGEIEEEIATLIPDNSALIATYGAPSTTSEDIVGGASGATYTAQGNGYVYVYGIGATSATALYLSNTTRVISDHKNGAQGNGISVIIPVFEGDVYTMGWFGVNISTFKFIYFEGEVQ